MREHVLACFGALLCASLPAFAGEVTGLTTFEAGTPARASEVNGNFGIVATFSPDTTMAFVDISNTLSITGCTIAYTAPE